MPKKSLGYVELEWLCPKCGTRNKGGQRTCVSCGAPQPEEAKFEQAAQQEILQDQEKIEQAKKGANIHCPYCGTRNPADAAVCSQCGGDLVSGVKRVSGQVVGAFRAGEAVEQIPCPNCSTLNPETNLKCTTCGATLRPEPAKPAAPQAPPARQGNRTLLYLALAAVAVLVIACIAYFIINSTKRNDLTATVANINWQRAIPILELRQVQRSGWIDEIPADAGLGNCEPRYHHSQDTPAENAVEVCGTPYTVDTGGGYAEVVQDCLYEVYVDYCAYTAEEWQAVDQVISQGNDTNPAWPQLSLAEGQQAGQAQEQYTIVFSTSDGQYTYTVSDPQAFSQFVPGSEWILVLNGFGQVVSVEPR
jgi:DNA-directed RNA polymerase subunit RPC12/RpoP